jgi:hypothetical protein
MRFCGRPDIVEKRVSDGFYLPQRRRGAEKCVFIINSLRFCVSAVNLKYYLLRHPDGFTE